MLCVARTVCASRICTASRRSQCVRVRVRARLGVSAYASDISVVRFLVSGTQPESYRIAQVLLFSCVGHGSIVLPKSCIRRLTRFGNRWSGARLRYAPRRAMLGGITFRNRWDPPRAPSSENNLQSAWPLEVHSAAAHTDLATCLGVKVAQVLSEMSKHGARFIARRTG